MTTKPFTCLGKFIFTCNADTEFSPNYMEMLHPVTEDELTILKGFNIIYNFTNKLLDAPVDIPRNIGSPTILPLLVPLPTI